MITFIALDVSHDAVFDTGSIMKKNRFRINGHKQTNIRDARKLATWQIKHQISSVNI